MCKTFDDDIVASLSFAYFLVVSLPQLNTFLIITTAEKHDYFMCSKV